MDKSMTVLRSV